MAVWIDLHFKVSAPAWTTDSKTQHVITNMPKKTHADLFVVMVVSSSLVVKDFLSSIKKEQYKEGRK
jgi:hypothetical protein